MIPLSLALPVTIVACLAALVETAAAFTLVLAVGQTRGWRPALLGAAAGVIILAALTAAFGLLLDLLPLALLQFAIGALLVLVGLKWLRHAILRAAGLLPPRDEARVFARESAELARHPHGPRAATQSLVAAGNAVLVKGIEIVFIVVALGAGRGLLVSAALGAAAAAVVIFAIGLVLRRPLAKFPDNALRFIVGLLLVSFGVFWTGAGLGAVWPGGDLSLLGIFVLFAAVALVAVGRLRPERRGQLRVVR